MTTETIAWIFAGIFLLIIIVIAWRWGR